MYKRICLILFTIISLVTALSAWAQDSTANKKVEMADAMRSNGKIYVVVAVLVIILSGLILYVIRLDKKISRLEKEATN
jgi:heme export protein D (CcmD)